MVLQDGKEDKIWTNEYETQNSTVERLSHEITILKERKMHVQGCRFQEFVRCARDGEDA